MCAFERSKKGMEFNMGNKEDWEEIEKWNRERNEKNRLKYKLDLSNMDKEEAKMRNFVNVLKTTGKGVKVLGIIIAIIVIFTIFNIIYIVFSNMRNSFYVDVEKDIETLKGVKVELISKDVVEAPGYKNENGTFYFRIKNFPEIQFTVIKKGGQSVNNYDSNLQKYLFNNWNSDDKKYFKTEEYVDINELSYYRNYIEITEYKDLELATEKLIDFLDYAENWNDDNNIIKYKYQKEGQYCVAPIGMIYIKINDKIISPYSELYITADKIRENAEKFYKEQFLQ